MKLKNFIIIVSVLGIVLFVGDREEVRAMEGMDHGAEMTMDHSKHSGGIAGHENMSGMYGAYSMSREASGTSWQPESTPMAGYHFEYEEWMMMVHGAVNYIYTDQGGARGGDKNFSTSMAMFMAQRSLGSGTLGLRSMLSLDPLMGSRGYPLLLQTGEVDDEGHSLIDRQHPHDLFMELALSYSILVDDENSMFIYAGLPGEPALGPAAFMHRLSASDNPEAPLSHHWLDSTHITFGVVTLGYVYQNAKIEGSVFHGQEPDAYRWNIEEPVLDSYALRGTYNPWKNWSLQISAGYLDSPEESEPEVDVTRFTASASHNKPLSWGNWQSMMAWGRNYSHPGKGLDAVLLESSLVINKQQTIFARGERVEKNELFGHEDAHHGNQAFNVYKFTLGYIYDFPVGNYAYWGIGGSYSRHFIPKDLYEYYGKTPESWLLFMRLKL